MIETTLGILEEIGRCVSFCGEAFGVFRRFGVNRHEVFAQIWRVTIQSLPTTAMAGFFVGAIMTVQFTMQVASYGALGYLGGLSTSATIRQVGPLLIAFMLSGKVGAFTAAELGTMRVTEQIDAIRCLGANPFQELILPRMIAIVLSSFALLAAGLLMSIAGGVLMGVIFSGINPDEYLRHVPTIVTIPSIATGLLKCSVFAVVLAAICTYKGYNATGGARGVGRAVVETAVATMVSLVAFDWVTSLLADTIIQIAISMRGGFVMDSTNGTISTAFGHVFGFSTLAARSIGAAFVPPFRIRDIVRQIHFVAGESLWIIVLCVCAAAMVTILEASFHMKLVIQNDSMVPGFAAMLILRELGAVVMALLVTSRAGAGMAAEVGSMQVTEQIEALQMLGLDPIRFLVAPRLIACAIAGAIMSLIANLVCLLAAMFVSVVKLGYTAGLFMSMSRPFVSGQDLIFAVIKGAVFGSVIPLFACYCGLRCKPGAEGVGLATTNAVVSTSIAIIVLDFILSYLFSLFY